MSVFITNDELQKFYDNGFTDDDIQNTINDYRNQGINDEEIRKKVDARLQTFTNPEEPLQNIQLNEDGSLQQPLQASVRKIDLRPSHLVDEAAKRVVALPVAGYNAIKNRSFKGAYSQALDDLTEAKRKVNELDPTGKKIEDAGNAVFDIGVVTALPEVKLLQGTGLGAKVINSALTNAYQGGLIGGIESLRNEGNLSGVGPSAAFGGTLGGAFPLVGAGISKLLPRVGSSLAGISPETIKQAIRPNSRALDLNPDTAQALLYDTTQNVRNAYNNLLSKRGQAVNDAVENLRGNQYRIPVEDLQSDITQTFDQYGGELINPARNLTRNLEGNLQELIASGGKDTPLKGLKGTTDITENTISPIDLEKAKQQIGNMINWSDETARNYQNPILEQIYGKYNSRLSDLSPELQAANENFANLRNFKNNEGLRRVLRAGDNIDSASSALKNYNSTVTKGNTGRNIQDLENILVANGSEPFLNTIDDINAAMDLSKSISTGRNFGGVTDIAKSLLVEPVLRGARAINRTGIPQQLNVLRENVPLSTVQMLYGLTRPFSE